MSYHTEKQKTAVPMNRSVRDAHAIAKDLENRYGTKQRDELRLKHPAIADGVEKIEETFGPVN